MNILESFRPTFENSVNQTGLEFSAEELTFRELEVRSNRLARRFAEDGLVAGDRVVVYLRNSPEFIISYLAILKAGLVFVPINILYREREVRQIVDDSEPRAAVTSFDLIDCLESCFQMEHRQVCFLYYLVPHHTW